MTTPTILTTSVDAAVEQINKEAGFLPVRSQLSTLVSLYISYGARCEEALNRSDTKTAGEISDQAISELEIVSGVDRPGLRRQLNDIAQVRSDVFELLSQEWGTLTGTDLPKDLNVGSEYDREMREQAALEERVVRLKTIVTFIDTALNLNVLAEPETQEQADKPRGLIAGLQGAIARRLVEQKMKELDQESTEVKPSWLTEAVLQEGNRNLRLLEERLNFVAAKIRSYQANEKTKDQAAELVKREMNNTPVLKITNLIQIMRTVWDLADRQDKLSDTIVANVKADVAAMQPRFQLVRDVDRMVKAVYDAYRLSEAR